MSIAAFLKFGKKEHILSLRDKGNIYLSFNNSFRKENDNKERYDRFEGAISNYYTDKGSLQIKAKDWEEWKELRIFNTNLNQFADTSNVYSYSLYALTLGGLQANLVYQVDSRMREFGSHFLMIRHPQVFLNKIKSFLDENEFEYHGGMVQYYDLKQTQRDLTLFNKPHTLKHQSEYRIVVKAKVNQPLNFDIGSISEYSEIYETKDLETFKIKLHS